MSKKEKVDAQGNPVKKEKGVPFGKLMAWSLRPGSTGVAMMIMGYLTVFAVNTMKMPAALVGGLLLASKLIDGVTDLFAGYIVDNTKTKLGKGRPYEWCVVGMWASALLMFCVPAAATTAVKAVWILLTYLFANSIFFTFLNANQTVYMVRAFSTQKEYVQLSTYGGVVPMLIVAVFNVIFPTLMGSIATSQAGWIKLVLLFAIPLAVLGMLRFFVVKETHDVDVKAANEKVKFSDILQLLKSNKYIYIIAFATLVMNVITNMGVAVFYFTDIVGNVGVMSVLALTSFVILPLMFIFPQLLKKISVMKLVRTGLIVTIVGYVFNFFAGSNVVMLIIGNLLFSAGVVPISMLSGLLIIECADYNEYIGMQRLEGSLGAVNGFANKVGAGLGSGLLGILIGMAGYDGNLAVQPASAITMIRLLYSLIPAAVYFIVYLVCRLYKLDKMMPEIRETNEANRAAAKAAEANETVE
ncbi:MAG: MFS transporter [Lachnospiraceae bacterium]|nr:MFS transporter [Lachnospiraceae bacterium]